MKCNKCGKTAPDDSIFCQFCGNKIETTPIVTPSNSTPLIKKSKKPVNKKLIVCLTVIPAILVIVVLLIAWLVTSFLIPKLKYNHAKELLENGNYDLAYSEFLALEGFSNSEDMLLECRYAQAVKYRDAGDYELANKIFESLGDYRDSKILIHKHEYKIINTVSATCTTAGSETYKCLNCEESYITVIDKLNHSYDVISSKDATCQEEGYKTYKCALCSNEYTEKLNKTLHDLVITSSKDSTCTSVGVRNCKCKNCSYSFSEEIAKKSHSYSAATCTTPKTCSVCKTTSGTALGHINGGVKCTRCGKITFQTLTYTGTGSKVIKNIVIPNGTFLITGYATSKDGWSGSFYVYLNYLDGDSAAYWIDTCFSYIEKAEGFRGPINNGYIEVDAGSNISWKITIEAVGN